jgi:hypothetical protein
MLSSATSDREWNPTVNALFASAAKRFGGIVVILACTILFVRTATANKETASGIFALLRKDKVQHPFNGLANEPCWGNPNIAGVVLRTDWATVEPALGRYNWGFLDTGISLGQANRKKIGISVDAGVYTPSWVYSLGAKTFTLAYGTMPAPWDPVFRTYWAEFLKQLASRYDNDRQLTFVTMAGPGRSVESFFALSGPDVAALNVSAGIQGWITAANRNTDSYANAFARTPFFSATGVPARGYGNAPMTAVIEYGLHTYPDRFGVQSNELSALTVATGNFPHTSLQPSELSPMGFQLLHSAKSKLIGGTLKQALNNGIALGAYFIEVYEVDCEDPAQQAVVSSVNQALLSAHP